MVKRQQRVDRIARRTAIAPAPIKLPILPLLEHGLELLEIERRRVAFDAQQLRHFARGLRSVAKAREQAQHAVWHIPVAHEHDALVVNLGADDLACELQSHAGQLEEPILSAPRVHAAGGKPAQQTKETSSRGEVGDINSKFQTRFDGLRGRTGASLTKHLASPATNFRAAPSIPIASRQAAKPHGHLETDEG